MVPLPVQQKDKFFSPPTAKPGGGGSSSRRTGAPRPKVLTFALQHRPRATRASVPKVRTGCITCKKRHVKCDEAKPSCQRCMKWQGYCDGYETSQSSTPAPSSSTSSQRDRSSVSSSSSSTDPTPTPSPPPLSTSSPPVPSSEDDQLALTVVRKRPPVLLEPDFNVSMFSFEWEKVYFDRWLAMAPNLGGGWFKSRLWMKIIPQLCQQEPAVRYGAMAIGAMASALPPSLIPQCPETLMANGPHYKNALTYYGRALRLARTQNAGDEASKVRAAVLACLLFVCFETLQGNRGAALHHISYGLQIVDQFIQASSPAADPGRTFRTALTVSPSPYVLDDEVLQVFRRLDFQAWSLGLFTAKRAREDDIRTALLGRVPLRELPAVFADLDDARRWWDLVQQWAIQFPRFMVAELEKFMAGVRPEVASRLDICDVPGARNLRREYLECLESWNRAFWPLYDEARENKKRDEASYLRAISLEIQYLISWVCVRSLAYSDYETMYQLTPQFRELNRLAAILLPKQPRPDGGTTAAADPFTMDNGPTMALFVVSTKCRREEVREVAATLLQKYPRRDGFWDSRPMYAIADCNRTLEAENETEGDLYEQWVRLRQREAQFDETKPEAVVTLHRKDPVTGEFRRVKETLRW